MPESSEADNVLGPDLAGDIPSSTLSDDQALDHDIAQQALMNDNILESSQVVGDVHLPVVADGLVLVTANPSLPLES